MMHELTCETSTVAGLGFKNQPDADDYGRCLSVGGDEAEPLTLIIDGVSHPAHSLHLCNNNSNGIQVHVHLATMDKLSVSVHGTQESNPSHHLFLDATSSGAELGDSEIPGPADSCAKSRNLVGDFGSIDDNRVVASILEEAVASVKWANIIHGEDKAVKCPWRIQIIDGTALIETSTSLEKENIEYGAKKEKRQVITGKKKNNSRATEEIVKKVVSFDKNFKVYSRKELEALRFQGLEAQKRRWVSVYSGLGAPLQKEYDGLVHFHPRLQEPKNKTKKKKNVNINPLFQNQWPPSCPGPWVAKQEYNVKPEEWAIGIFGRHVQNIF